jgi:hypothetical protein
MLRTPAHSRPYDLRRDVAEAVRDAWTAATSTDPEAWTAQNPAYGQCAVTALVVQDALGGEILRGRVGQTSHYLNRLPDGSLLDLTWEQFPDGALMTDVELK